MNRNLKKIWNVCSLLIVITVVLLALLLFAGRFIGLDPYTVLSGSMEPQYRTGSLLYVRKPDLSSLAAGDVITFKMGSDIIVTHRISEILPDENDPSGFYCITKGDANPTPDANPVHSSSIIGEAVFALPKLGFLASYIQNPPGRYVCIAVGAFLALLMLIPDLLSISNGGKRRQDGKHCKRDLKVSQ